MFLLPIWLIHVWCKHFDNPQWNTWIRLKWLLKCWSSSKYANTLLCALSHIPLPGTYSACHFKESTLTINCVIWMPNVYHTESQDGWRGNTTRGHLVQHPSSSRGLQSTTLRTVSRWLLNVSREADSTTSPSILFQCSVTYTVKFFLMFGWKLPCPSFCLPIVSHSYCWNHWEEPGYILLAPSLQILEYIDKIPSQSSAL